MHACFLMNKVSVQCLLINTNEDKKDGENPGKLGSTIEFDKK